MIARVPLAFIVLGIGLAVTGATGCSTDVPPCTGGFLESQGYGHIDFRDVVDNVGASSSRSAFLLIDNCVDTAKGPLSYTVNGKLQTDEDAVYNSGSDAVLTAVGPDDVNVEVTVTDLFAPATFAAPGGFVGSSAGEVLVLAWQGPIRLPSADDTGTEVVIAELLAGGETPGERLRVDAADANAPRITVPQHAPGSYTLHLLAFFSAPAENLSGIAEVQVNMEWQQQETLIIEAP